MRCLTQKAASGQTDRDERRARKGDYLKPIRTARSLRIPLLAAAAGILLAAAAALSLFQPSAGRADPAIDCFEQEFLSILNQHRAQNGRQPLALNSQLSAAADWMSGDLGAKKYFSHIDSLGRSPGQRAQDYGYFGGVGENIAGGMSLSTAQKAFDAWKGSPGHNQNMLGSSYRVIGIGRVYVPDSPYGTYWTTDFGQSPNAVDDPPITVTCGNTPGPTATQQPTPTPQPSPATPTPTATATPTLTPTPTPTGVMPTPAPTHTPAPPTPTEPATIFGDVDCDLVVGSTDALAVLRLVALLSEQPECHSPADVDCDGRVTAVDALDILLYVVSQPQQPGPGCPPIGSLG
jgi:uncharacterized protein YkwD